MKVLFLISSFPKLSETFILNQLTGMIDNDVEIDILAWNEVKKTKQHKEVESYKLIEKTTFINLPTRQLSRILGATKIFLTHVWKNPRITFNTLNYQRYGKIIFNFRLIYALPFFLKKAQYQAVICHYGPNGEVAAFFQEQGKLSEKTFVFFHGHDITSFVKRWGNNIYRTLFRSKINILSVSELFKKELLNIGANPQLIDVHHMGVNLNQFSYVAPSSLMKEISFLSIGRLTEKKGLDIAIRTIAELNQRGISCHLDIIGEGELRGTLNELIHELGLTEKVSLKGWQPQTEINQAIENADILLLLSKTAQNGDKEGIPVVLMESMARGKLVVGTNHSGIPELLKDKKNGWVVPENNVDEAVNTIIKIVENPELNERISINARKSVMEEFNIETLNKRLIERCVAIDDQK